MPNNDDQSSSLTCPYCKAPVVRALVEAEVAIGEYDEAEGIHAFAGSMVGYRCTVNPEHGFYLGEVFDKEPSFSEDSEGDDDEQNGES